MNHAAYLKYYSDNQSTLVYLTPKSKSSIELNSDNGPNGDEIEKMMITSPLPEKE